MQIQKIHLIPKIKIYSNSLNDTPQKSEEIKQEQNNIRFAYRDFNIHFGERLFRTPANFWAQSFNQKGMTERMRVYLYDDFEDRQNMPPFQMLKYVYDDLNYIDNLDYVKRHYADEPLFQNLTNEPNKKARKGVLFEYEALKDEMNDQPLLKDGTSNLGIYLLRKIYLEGKTLNEIQADFKEDLSPIYNGLITSDIDYDTLHSYGIKFPDNAFWKSFTANRETYPYVYKPRKADTNGASGSRERSLSDILNGHNDGYVPHKPKNRFKIKDEQEAKRMGDAVLSGHGNAKLTNKALRHKGIHDDEELSFVSKYLSQIMSVALEKTHASEEMRNFFEQYDSMNKKQKEKMESYWRNNPFMRDLQSLAISDTIKLFFEAYGADGNNDEFKELLAYADSIKPVREARYLEHERLQEEYENLFASFEDEISDKTSETPAEQKPAPVLTEEEVNALLEKEAIKNGARVFVFENPETGEVFRYVGKMDEMIYNEYTRIYKLMPRGFVTRYMNYLQKSPLATDRYLETAALINNVPEFVQNQLMSPDECFKISERINEEFNKKYGRVIKAAETALAVMLIKSVLLAKPGLLVFNADQLSRFAIDTLNIDSWTPEEKQTLDKLYKEYTEPVKNKEDILKINRALVEYLSAISPDSPEWASLGVMDSMDALIAQNLRQYPKLKNLLVKELKYDKFIENYNGTPKILLDDSLSKHAKIIKSKLILEDFMHKYPDVVIEIVSIDIDNILKYIKDPEIKRRLINQYYSRR